MMTVASRTPNWRGLLVTTGTAIGICCGVAWALITQHDQGVHDKAVTRTELAALVSQLDARLESIQTDVREIRLDASPPE